MDEYNDKPQFEVAERSELPAINKVSEEMDKEN